MATKKNPTKVSSVNPSSFKKTDVRAGKSKANALVRAKQNAGVKDGTIKLGASGKSYNVWDAKTSSWKRGIVTKGDHLTNPALSRKASTPKTPAALGRKASTPKSGMKYGNR
jgi:hypothetical protein